MTKIHREIYGQGAPLVMIHGWAMHSGVWREFAKQLSQHAQVICLDLPGHGRSGELNAYTLPKLSEALLDAIPVEEFRLLGWSLGANVAIDMASRFPGRVKSLLLLSGNPRFVQAGDWPGVNAEVLDAFIGQLDGDVRKLLTRFLALQVNGLENSKHLLTLMQQALQDCELPSLEALRSGLHILRDNDSRQALAGLQCPVTAIQGDSDTLIPLQTATAIQALNPQITVQILEKVGHVAFLSHAPQLLDAVRRGL